jgi:3-methylfumaryl-CoA hydratase
MTEPQTIDMDHLNTWLGNTETLTDIITPGLVDRFRATFGARLYDTGDDAPIGLHWCLSPLAVPFEEIGPDGHPARGGFLPPVPLESRMWAGGEVAFHHPLKAGDEVTRHSQIASITPKSGRSGPLVFVAVNHEISVGGRVAIRERQDIVYRPASKPAPVQPASTQEIPEGAYVGDALTLFRYSAMTFNGHRIHYDHPYVTKVEGYPGLVVHGPLQATLLLNAAAMKVKTPAIRFDYRGLSSLTEGLPVMVRTEDDRAWLEKTDGTVTFDGRFSTI